MPSNGLTTNRKIPGDDSENYCATLFGMDLNPERVRRPDLVSLSNTYDPNLSIEVKSSLNCRGSLVVAQLCYGLTKDEEYAEELNKIVRNPELFSSYIDKETGVIDRDTAFYYNVIHRTCGTKGDKLQTPYSAIRLTYGDQFFVPHDFVFDLFAIHYARLTSTGKIQVKRRKTELKKLILHALANKVSLSSILKRLTGKNNGWQDLQGRLIKALVTEDYKKISKLDRFNIKYLKKHHEGFSELERTIIQGPNNSQIYCLYNLEHQDLFEHQLKYKIEENTPVIEELTEMRKELLPLISKFQPYIQQMSNGDRKRITRFANGNLPNGYHKELKISLEQMNELERLCKWKLVI